MSRLVHAFTLLVVASVTLAACSSEPDTPPARQSSYFDMPLPTATLDPAEATGATGGTDASSIGAPGGGGTGTLASGVVSIRVTGDLRVERTLRTLVTATYSPPPGGLALVWTAGDTDASTVGIGGASFVGSEPSTPTLTLTITVPTPGGGFETFVSMDGECTVSLREATASGLSGSFRCEDLRSATGTVVGATATFSATG